jgi:hypothetical protein
MIINILAAILATILWVFCHFGIKNYEYNTSDKLTFAKVICFVIYIFLTFLIFL